MCHSSRGKYYPDDISHSSLVVVWNGLFCPAVGIDRVLWFLGFLCFVFCLLQELVIDIDMTDYKDVMGDLAEGSEVEVCDNNWPYMAAAVKVRKRFLAAHVQCIPVDAFYGFHV